MSDHFDDPATKEEVERRHRLEGLTGTVAGLTEVLGVIRERLDERPDRREVAANVRRRAVLLLAVIVAAMWGVDQHVTKCSPGAKTHQVVQAVSDGNVTSLDEFIRRANVRLARHCDITQPLHAHSDHDRWPTGGNLVGFALYVAAFAVSVGWWRQATRRL